MRVFDSSDEDDDSERSVDSHLSGSNLSVRTDEEGGEYLFSSRSFYKAIIVDTLDKLKMSPAFQQFSDSAHILSVLEDRWKKCLKRGLKLAQHPAPAAPKVEQVRHVDLSILGMDKESLSSFSRLTGRIRKTSDQTSSQRAPEVKRAKDDPATIKPTKDEDFDSDSDENSSSDLSDVDVDDFMVKTPSKREMAGAVMVMAQFLKPPRQKKKTDRVWNGEIMEDIELTDYLLSIHKGIIRMPGDQEEFFAVMKCNFTW